MMSILDFRPGEDQGESFGGQGKSFGGQGESFSGPWPKAKSFGEQRREFWWRVGWGRWLRLKWWCVCGENWRELGL